MPTRALIYARQSRERDESTSIEDQERICRQYCAEKGWDVVDVVIDRDTSGSEMPWSERRNFPTVFDTDCDVLVLYRWDRLSRRRFDQEEILQKWGALGRDMQAATEPIDATTATGDLNRAIILMFAAHQAKVIGERWRETLNRRLEAGLPKHGLDRFGYVKDGKAYVVDPVTGPILRDLYLRYIAGAGFGSLRDDLNERGITTTKGKPWSQTSLTRVLTHGFGAGVLYVEGEGFAPGAHEGVITADEWQAFLDARAARKKLPPRRQTATWYLSGIATCGICGGRMHGRVKEAVCGVYTNRGKTACTGTFILRPTLERTVTMWIGANVEAFPQREVVDVGERNVVADLEARLAAVSDRLVNLAEGFADGILDRDGYRGAQSRALDEKAQVEGALRDARRSISDAQPLTEDEWSRLELGEGVTTGEWNALLKRVLRRVEVHKDRLVVVPVVGDEVEVAR